MTFHTNDRRKWLIWKRFDRWKVQFDRLTNLTFLRCDGLKRGYFLPDFFGLAYGAGDFLFFVIRDRFDDTETLLAFFTIEVIGGHRFPPIYVSFLRDDALLSLQIM